MSIAIRVQGKSLVVDTWTAIVPFVTSAHQRLIFAKGQVVQAYRELGEILLAVRKNLPYGTWYSFLKDHGIHQKTAERAMRAHERCYAISEINRTNPQQCPTRVSDLIDGRRCTGSAGLATTPREVAEALDAGGVTVRRFTDSNDEQFWREMFEPETDYGEPGVEDEFEELPVEGVDDIEDAAPKGASGEQLSLAAVFDTAAEGIARARTLAGGVGGEKAACIAAATTRYVREVESITREDDHAPAC